MYHLDAPFLVQFYIRSELYSHLIQFGWVIGFIGLLKLVTTINYSAIANSNTLQLTTAHTPRSKSAVASPVVAR
jgi:hypothetical protein